MTDIAEVGFDRVNVLRIDEESYEQLLEDYKEEFQMLDASRDDLEVYFNIPISVSNRFEKYQLS